MSLPDKPRSDKTVKAVASSTGVMKDLFAQSSPSLKNSKKPVDINAYLTRYVLSDVNGITSLLIKNGIIKDPTGKMKKGPVLEVGPVRKKVADKKYAPSMFGPKPGVPAIKPVSQPGLIPNEDIQKINDPRRSPRLNR